MDPAVVPAWIAAGASGLTLVTTVAVQSLSQRASTKNAEATAAKALIKQQEQLDQTFAEQRDQLDRTLAEQIQQLDRTLTEQRSRTLNERFGAAAEQLGSDKPAVRLAGVYAMAGLADDWEENRQICVDVLCAYLRMPYEPDPGPALGHKEQRLAFEASREVRHTVIRVITAHLKKDAAASWQGLNFDFTSVFFDGGDFTGAEFSGGEVSFYNAKFLGGEVNFTGAEFSGGRVDFTGAEFSGGLVDFTSSSFSGGTVYFNDAQFSGGLVDFDTARFSGGTVHFSGARFFGGLVNFDTARFSGGTVDFTSSSFSGGEVDFSGAREWSKSPAFPWTGTAPPGVTLPSGAA
jgi:uncharacterized protein YjbI with pentapeptide repeats